MTPEQRAALVSLDIEWARRYGPLYTRDDELLLIALHKARYASRELPPEVRHASAEWLRERGYCSIQGQPLLPPGYLP